MKNVSVIIPMYNAERFLQSLFDCLNACSFIEGDQVIIIDNGSSDNSNKICSELSKSRPDLYKIIYYDEKSDSYAARNFGLQYSTGDILAFTDSDCKPTKEWLEEIRKLEKGVVLAGDVVLEVNSNSIWELYDSVAHLSQCENNAKMNCVATANMSVHKDDFYKVGLFEERFSGGDFEWSKKATSKGLKVYFNRNAIVYHPSRKSYEEIKKREQRVAYGRGVHHKNEGGSYFSLLVGYLLRIFYLKTQFRYSREMKKKGATINQLVEFNAGFLAIRWWYVVFASRGYKGLNPRTFGIK